MDHAAAPEPDAARRLGRYEVLGELASGGMAQVLLARATGLGGFARSLVIKRLHPELAADEAVVRMFLDEARLSASLHHPNIVTVLDVDRADDGVYMVMELLHGRDLRALLRRVTARGERIPLPLVLHLVQGVCAGLHHAHEHTDERGQPLGIIHRDISPHNVFATYEGAVKVIDFGIAKAAGRLDATRTGTIKGKFGYMSPEQCRGRALDRRSDVFCVGILLSELSTCTKLYDGADDYELLRAVVEAPARRPSATVPDYPPALEAIVMKALEHDPARRHPTALALLEELEAFKRAHGLEAGPLELARYLRRLFARELAAWDSARGDGHHQLAALRASSDDAPGPPAEPPPRSPTVATVTLERSSSRPRGRRIALGAGLAGLIAAGGLAFGLGGEAMPTTGPARESAAPATPVAPPAATSMMAPPRPAPAQVGSGEPGRADPAPASRDEPAATRPPASRSPRSTARRGAIKPRTDVVIAAPPAVPAAEPVAAPSVEAPPEVRRPDPAPPKPAVPAVPAVPALCDDCALP